MDYRYIVLLSSEATPFNAETLAAHTQALSARGMRLRNSSSRTAVFLSEHTSAIVAPDGRVVIGQLFCNDGNHVRSDVLGNVSGDTSLFRFLLKNFWGDYVAITPGTDDAPSPSVFRDPSGGMACVYSIKNGAGFITSDVSLATDLGLYSKSIDWDLIAHALVYPYLKVQRTGLIDVSELLPGCSLHITRTGTTVTPEWSPWDLVDGSERLHDPREAVELTRQAVTTAVSASAKVDRSILVELSGGLDSSIVATCLLGSQAHVACSTLVTPTPGADERVYAEPVASKLGVELHTETLNFSDARIIFPTPPNAVAPRIGVLHHLVDELMTSIASNVGATSFYSGGGGDTVFGYLHSAAPAADAFKERGVRAGISAVHNLSVMHKCTFWKAGQLAVRKLTHPTRPLWKAERSLLHPTISSLEHEPHPWLSVPKRTFSGDVERITGLVATQAFRENAPRVLRLPLLTQPVIEACLRIPTWMCIRGGENRSVARAAFSDRLPAVVLNRRSKGSFMSFYGGVYQRNKNQIRAFLKTGHLMDRQLLDSHALAALFDSNCPPRDTSFTRVFDLCMIENWVQNQG